MRPWESVPGQPHGGGRPRGAPPSCQINDLGRLLGFVRFARAENRSPSVTLPKGPTYAGEAYLMLGIQARKRCFPGAASKLPQNRTVGAAPTAGLLSSCHLRGGVGQLLARLSCSAARVPSIKSLTHLRSSMLGLVHATVGICASGRPGGRPAGEGQSGNEGQRGQIGNACEVCRIIFDMDVLSNR